MKRETTPAIDRVLSKVAFDSGCWIFTGARHRFGYGLIGIGRRGAGKSAVHRVTYEALVGPIPEGMEIDHLCRNPPCCNPLHLEAVSHTENVRRAPRHRVTAPMVAASASERSSRTH